MPYCADCRMEYREGSERCADCGAVLVAGPMGDRPEPADENWQVLMRVGREQNASIIHGLLRSHGISCEVVNKALSEMPVPSASSSYFEVWVPGESAEKARALLNEAREGTRPCGSCGHMTAAEEPRCEYCAEPLSPGRPI